MIDIRKIQYTVSIYDKHGHLHNVTPLLQSTSFGETDSELACRMTVMFKNQKYNETYMTSLASPGTVLLIHADWGAGNHEVFRGDINIWHYRSSSKKDLDLNIFDDLYKLQESEEVHYYTAGTSSKTIILEMFERWGIPLATYNGPDFPMPAFPIKAEKLGNVAARILELAEERGYGQFIIRMNKGKAEVVPRGSNTVVYHFSSANNTILTSDRVSIENLLTRVKVVGREDSKGWMPVEAVLDGKTEFGIRQRIYQRPQDDSLATAQAAAKKILEMNGSPERSITIEAPDIPFLKKGDKIYITAGNLSGYFFIKNIQHDLITRIMQAEVET
jgi:hypothetical protein